MLTMAKYSRLVGVVVICASLVLGTGQVFADTSSAPAAAVAAQASSGNWIVTTPGSSTYYPFQYAGDGSQIVIDMATNPSLAASFKVFTPQEFANGASTAIGQGTPNAKWNNDLVWSGNFNFPGTYMVQVVMNQPGSYRLSVTGSGVVFAPPGAPAANAQPVTLPLTGSSAADGSSPSAALPADIGWRTATEGGNTWYAFNYAGDGSQIVISMPANTGNLSFNVFTPGEVASGSDPVGVGSADPAQGGTLVWSGNFPQRGIYYIQVLQRGAGVYALKVTGSGVSFNG
jgi:hypothetical protein